MRQRTPPMKVASFIAVENVVMRFIQYARPLERRTRFHRARPQNRLQPVFQYTLACQQFHGDRVSHPAAALLGPTDSHPDIRMRRKERSLGQSSGTMDDRRRGQIRSIVNYGLEPHGVVDGVAEKCIKFSSLGSLCSLAAKLFIPELSRVTALEAPRAVGDGQRNMVMTPRLRAEARYYVVY